MARPKRKKQPAPEPMDTPTQAQLEKGGYERKFVTHVETNTRSMAFISSHDPVERWLDGGRLTSTQFAAIALLRRLWAFCGVSQRVTANYGERIAGSGSVEYRAINEIEARDDLHRIQDYVPKPYFDVFENVCRHGMPAGVAGAALGFGTRSGDVRAHQIVCFVADIVAMRERL